MTTSAPEPVSLADCTVCAVLPAKIHVKDLELPAAVDQLVTAVEIAHEFPDPFREGGSTRLLRCPGCLTYYYWNIYDEESHWPDTMGGIERTVRRLDPVSAADFLDGVIGDDAGRLPPAFGQLVNAFVSRSGPVRVDADTAPGREAAILELAALRGREPATWRSLEALLADADATLQLRLDAARALCFRAAIDDDWPRLSRELLHHAEPAVRMAIGRLIYDVGTTDGPVIDILDVPRSVRAWLERIVKKRAHLDELLDVARAAVSAEGTIALYDHGYGESSYIERPVRDMAAKLVEYLEERLSRPRAR